MPVSPKVLGALVILAAPAPALAQTALAAVGSGMSGQVAAAPAADSPRVTLAARKAAMEERRTTPAPRALDLTVRGDDRLSSDVELREKDAWTDDEGFQVKPTKVAYVRRF